MAKNSGRAGLVTGRSQFFNFITSLWQKRETTSGKIKDVKTSGGKFKGVRTEKKFKRVSKKKRDKSKN